MDRDSERNYKDFNRKVFFESLSNHPCLLCGCDVVDENRKLFLPLNKENMVAYQVNLGP